MPAHTGNTPGSTERRGHARQRLSAIVYLDIGAGNGGIVLNLSDEGLGFQAVGPLGKQSELRLRIKLPSAPARIDVAAQIVWVSDSNRQAGVRFLDANSDGILQIQEWIRSLTAPPAPREEPSKQSDPAAIIQAKQEIAREPERNKGSISDSENELQESTWQEPPQVTNAVMLNQVPDAQEDASCAGKSEPITQPVVTPAEPPFVVQPALEEESSESSTLQAPISRARLEPDSSEAIVVTRSHDLVERESAQGWPAPIARASAKAIPQPPDAPLKPIQLFVSAGESHSEPAPAAVNTIFDASAAMGSKRAWNRTEIGVFFALCAVICFGIGTWVGQIVVGRHVRSRAIGQANAVQTAGQNVNGSAGVNIGKPAATTGERPHAGPAASHSPAQNRKSASSTNSEGVSPKGQSAPPSVENQNVTAAAISNEQESKVPVAAAIENSPAPEKSVAAATIAKGKESEPPPAPAMENSAAATPSPRMAGGLILKPSDRFNPCHLAYRVEATYPTEALEQRIEGVVKIQQVVGADGKVQIVKLLSGPPALAPAALEAARYWRYLPALLNGQPVETEQDIEIAFRLPQ